MTDPSVSPIAEAPALKPCPFTSASQRRDTYRSWESMRSRCLNPKHVHFHDYGGRGVGICDQWRESFDAFVSDVGPRPSRDVFLDRIDNDGNYEPGNVRWATRKEQHRNKRNNRHLTAFGVTRTLAEWAEVSGIRKQTIRMRLCRGWSVELAVSDTPSLDPTRHLTPEREREMVAKRLEARWANR